MPFEKGKPSIRKGVKLSDELKQKMSLSKLGKLGKKGRHWKLSEETKKKQSKSKKGIERSIETKDKISETRKRKMIEQGFLNTPEARLKMSKSRKGDKCNFYIDGRSGERNNPYSIDWTNTLRISIRERDHYTCQICEEKQGDVAYSIHHIDYDKLNCNPDNLITLCRSCHMKTNSNRKTWIIYFNKLNKNIMEIKLVIINEEKNVVKEFKGEDATHEAIDYLSGLVVDSPVLSKDEEAANRLNNGFSTTPYTDVPAEEPIVGEVTQDEVPLTKIVE